LANESKSGALKVSSREELQAWLESLPPEQGRWVAVAIAARAALRGAALNAADVTREDEKERKSRLSELTFSLFFTSALARVAISHLSHAEELSAVTSQAVASLKPRAPIAASPRDVVLVAVDSALSDEIGAKTSRHSIIVQAAVFAAFFAQSNHERSAVSLDALFISSGRTAQHLVCFPLWPDGEPKWIEQWRQNLQEILPREDDWQVWIDWYNRRIEGVSDPEEIELVFATVPDKEREAGPAAANKWIKERLEELTRKKPTVPSALPATIEPIIADGKIALPANAAEVDLDSETLGAALMALRTQIADLAGDLDGEANIDKRVISFLRRLGEKIPQAPPAQAQLFMLAHEQETLEAYGKTVATEWPALLAGRYLATTLALDRTVRQFPKWRLFKQNADKNRLTDQQRAEAPRLTADFAAALREEEATEYVAAEIPDTFEELCRRLDAARDEAREDRIAAGVDTLAEDAVVSIENMLKLMAETALAGVKRAANAVTKAGVAYVDNFEEGMVDQAKKEGKKDSAALVKWSKRILVGAAVGAGAKTAGIGAVIAKLMVTYPQIGKWLGPMIDLISN
jgi:hypothetical protein